MKKSFTPGNLLAMLVCAVLLAGASRSGAQGAMTNGALHNGTITTNNFPDSWTFTANEGDNIVLRIGTVGFAPQLDLYSPSDEPIDSSPGSPGTGSRDASITVQVTNSGTFTVLAQSYYPGDSGTYTLSLAQMPGAFEVSPGDEGGTLANGAANYATNSLGDLDLWSFTANAGDNIVLRIGTTDFVPQLDIYSPNGELIGSTPASPGTGSRDASVTLQVADSGTFTVVAQSYYLGDSGTYTLSLAQMPGAFVVSPGDEGGTLINGAVNYATNSLGDLDLWSFTANAGDNIVVRCGATDFAPRLDVYSPDGELIGSSLAGPGTGSRDASVTLQAADSGTFTVVAQSYYPGGSGAYALSLAQMPGAFVVSPGDEGGTLTNGAANYATNSLGDLDMWSFTANAGDNIVVRCGATDFAPRLDVYSPNGDLIGSSLAGSGTGSRDASVTVQVTNSGTFTVLAQSYYLGDSGAYTLSLAQMPGAFVVSPGDEGGTLTNGAVNHATNSLGDLDLWSFTANAGDSIAIRCGATDFAPRLDVYSPSGERIGSSLAGPGTGSRDASVTVQVTNSGTFAVLAQSYYLGDSGAYTLSLAQMPGTFEVSPGDEGGTLISRIVRDGVITLGDLDMWRLAACQGQLISVSCQKLTGGTGFTPRIRLFDRSGQLLATSSAEDLASIDLVAAETGVYTVIVDGGQYGDTGTYQLTGNGLADELSLCPPIVTGPNLSLGLYGGVSNSNAGFILLASTNVTTPMASWTPVSTNQFDQSGIFDYTNLFNPLQSRRFFRLKQ